MSKSKTEIVTTAIQWVVGASTAFTVRRALKNNVDPKNKREQLELEIGSLATGAMVGELSEGYIKRFIDSVVEPFQKNDDDIPN